MDKVFIVTEKELTVQNAHKQTEILEFLASTAQENPHYDFATLLQLAQQQIDENEHSWDYKNVPAVEETVAPAVEEPAAEVTAEEAPVEEENAAEYQYEDAVPYNYDNSLTEEVADETTAYPTVEETPEAETGYVSLDDYSAEETPVRPSFDDIVTNTAEPIQAVEETAVEEPAPVEEEAVEDEHATIVSRAPRYRGLFSEADKLDRLN